ncbi:acyl carrier protein [Streptomyces sp. KMM 9044]|uniref:acyl carrier protein n=1 Tax=Streptomyces sp. KMM 9044 TaxID=2744474 RepID=UPI0022B22554|nr:beta-ketoacyl reductase [Streptomyces sp. KMM 9044]WAX81206.1 beta-ketoacyl reductase [Streptomyces sp. KMM 9044]
MGLGSVLEGGGGAVVVADVEWERFVPAFTSRRPSPLLSSLPGLNGTETDSAGEKTTGDARAALTARLAGRPETERRRALRELVCERATLVLGRTADASMDVNRAFRDVGFDSLTAVELRNRLNAETGLRLPSTLVFDHPTPRHLADHLHDELFAGPEAAPGGSATPAGSYGSDEARFRSTLAAIPFSQWQQSGLLTAVLTLAESDASGTPEDDGDSAHGAIGEMDVDALVQLALGDSTS